MRTTVGDITDAEGRQRLIVELYDKFFKVASPKTVEKLGIVYTPVEVVDFIIRSVGYIIQKEFGRSLLMRMYISLTRSQEPAHSSLACFKVN